MAQPLVVLGEDDWVSPFSGVADTEFLPALQGEQGRRVYKQMADNSPVIGAAIYLLRNLLLAAPIDVDPGGDDEAGELLRSCMDDMKATWRHVLGDMLTMFPYGWSFCELLYKQCRGEDSDPLKNSKFDDGLIRWANIALRRQASLDEWWTEDGRVLGMKQRLARGGVARIPFENGIHLVTEHNGGHPEGRSLLRNSYVPWYYSTKIRTFEGIGIERDLAGLPKVGVPSAWLKPEATAEEKVLLAQVKRLAENVRRDAQGCVIYGRDVDDEGNEIELVKFELISGPGESKHDTDKILNRLNLEMLIPFLMDFVLLGHEAVGSKALSTSKTEVFGLAVQGWAESIVEELNRQAVPPLLRMNGWRNLPDPPKFAVGKVVTPPIDVVAKAIADLCGAGMGLFPDDGVETRIRAALSLPPKGACESMGL